MTGRWYNPAPARFDVLLVNRFAPPDGAPTGLAAAELGERLRGLLPGARIGLLASGARYRPAAAGTSLPVERMASLDFGRWPPARLIGALLEGWRLAERAARLARVVVALSDPPLLPLWVGRACRRHDRRWIEWSLDRYPDFFVAAGLVAETDPLYRRLAAYESRLRPDAVIAPGPGLLSRLLKRRGVEPPAFLLPAGLVPPPPRPAPSETGTLVYAGTLGEAHDPAAIAAIAAGAAAAGWRVRLAVRGGRAGELRRRLAGRTGIEWPERLALEELAGADAHLVSLAARATNLAVPSKAVTAVCLGRPFLFAGRAAADTWRELGAAGWLIPERPEGGLDPAALERALTGLADPVARREREQAAAGLAAALHNRAAISATRLAALIGSWLR